MQYDGKSAVLIYSGGLDSTVLLYHLLHEGVTKPLRVLSIDYGQRHGVELDHALAITYPLVRAKLVDHKVMDLSRLATLMPGSSQTDYSVPVPEGHYAEESMKLTIVPNRNMMMLSVAGVWAIATKSDFIAYAAHAGDHAIYPDCREEFVRPLSEALYNADWHHVSIERPFINKTKADIARLGAEMGVPMSLTWSCYKGGEGRIDTDKHCGKCGTCVERREAFELAGVSDPTEYVA